MLILRWLLFIGFATLLSRRGKHPEKKLDAPKNGTDPAYRQQPNRSPEPAYENGWHPQEEKHRRHEGWYWFASILLSAVVAIGAGLSAIYAYKAVEAGQAQAKAAQDQTEIARRALIASDRPWLQVVNFSVAKMTIDAENVMIWATVTLRNVGHSPALSVDMKPELSTYDSRGLPGLPLDPESVCVRAKERPYNAYSDTIFPSQDKTLPQLVFWMHASDIRKAQVARIVRQSPNWLPMPNVSSIRIADTFTLAGCALYKSIGEVSYHGTSFGMTLARRCPEDAFGCPFDLMQFGTVPINTLHEDTRRFRSMAD